MSDPVSDRYPLPHKGKSRYIVHNNITSKLDAAAHLDLSKVTAQARVGEGRPRRPRPRPRPCVRDPHHSCPRTRTPGIADSCPASIQHLARSRSVGGVDGRRAARTEGERSHVQASSEAGKKVRNITSCHTYSIRVCQGQRSYPVKQHQMREKWTM